MLKARKHGFSQTAHSVGGVGSPMDDGSRNAPCAGLFGTRQRRIELIKTNNSYGILRIEDMSRNISRHAASSSLKGATNSNSAKEQGSFSKSGHIQNRDINHMSEEPDLKSIAGTKSGLSSLSRDYARKSRAGAQQARVAFRPKGLQQP